MNETESLKLARTFLGRMVTVTIDRPFGSKHPKHSYVYPVNYGFIKNIEAPDGEELDAYVLGIDDGLEEFSGVCIAIVHRDDDDDDKLVVVPESMVDLSDGEIMRQVHFQEQWFDSVVVRE